MSKKSILKILQIDYECTGCGACISSCPKDALSLLYDNEGFYYPHLDSKRCIDCKLCEKACHVLNKDPRNEPSKNYTPFMVKSKDKNVLRNSSSGGAFSILSGVVLDQGGIVFGARYNFEAERLEHCSTDLCTIEELRKSKYIESYTGTIFKDVLFQLLNGRKTLFCGTPCQIEGLSHYLKQKNVDTTNLILVRILCHGVPANKYFTEYKHFEEKRFHSKLTSFDFRPKTQGWWSIDWKMSFQNGVIEQGYYNLYYYYYYYYLPNNLTLRKCCYNCKYINNETADFTIADFWGIKQYRPTPSDNEGVSLVLVHSSKADNLLQSISSVCECSQLPQSAVDYIYNSSFRNTELFQQRLAMSKQIAEKGFMKIAKDDLKNQIFKNRLFHFKDKLLKCLLRNSKI